jgi:hypothetical protein
MRSHPLHWWTVGYSSGPIAAGGKFPEEMDSTNMKARIPAIFALGTLIGALAMSGYSRLQHRDPVLSSTGRVQVDTISHADPRLDNAVFIDNPDAPLGRMFLKFRDDETMNEAIGKNVTVTGSLHAVQLDDGQTMTELHVGEIKHLPASESARTTGSSPTQEAESPVPSVADLSRRVRAALPQAGVGLRLSPALPAAWPPRGSELEWFTYQRTPLPTGVVAYEVNGPIHKVSLLLPEGEVRVEVLQDGKDLGREDDRPLASHLDLSSAEHALVEVVLGRRAPDDARADLAAYAKWTAASPVVGADLRRRKAAFFRWLDAATP